MGRMTVSEIAGLEDVTIVAGIERDGHPEIGTFIESIPIIANSDDLPEADVWLDFSFASPAVEHVRQAAVIGKPVLLATTGYSIAELEELQELSKHCPVLMASNLSAGVGVLESISMQAARMLPTSFEAGIFELHHIAKKDSPSGTALRLAERIAEYAPRPGIASMRAGGAIGEHQVRFVGVNEELVLIHRAWSRRAFSSGIERALKFIVKQPAGYYMTQDIYSVE